MLQTVLVERAAELLRVSRRTVYYRIREGKLRTIRTRYGTQRVIVESIVALIAAGASAHPAAGASTTGPSARSQAP